MTNRRKYSGVPASTVPGEYQVGSPDAPYTPGTGANQNPLIDDVVPAWAQDDADEVPAWAQDDGPQPSDEKRHYQEWEVLPNMINNLPISTAKLIGNMANAFTHPVDTLNGLTDIVGGVPLALMPEDWRNNITKDNPTAQRMLHGAQAMWQDYVDHYGGKQAIVDTIAGDPARVATDLATVGSMVPGAARAAAAVNPINWAKVVPEVIGKKTGATAAAAKFADKVLDTFIVPENLNPFAGPIKVTAPGPTKSALNHLVGDAVEGQEQLAHNALVNHQPSVPGVQHNAGDAIAKEVTATKLQALVNAAKEHNPDPFTMQEQANNIARLSDVRQVGRGNTIDDAQLSRAGLSRGSFDPAAASIDDLERALEAADSANYGPLDARRVRGDEALSELFNRPSGDIVQAIAKEIAAEEGRDFPNYTPAQSTTSTVLDQFGRPMVTETPAEYPLYRGEDLIRIKKAFDRLASSRELRAKYAIDDEAARKIAGTREQFVRWMEDPIVDPETGAALRLPEHATAVSDSRAWRQLIDRRRAAQVFEEALTGPLMGEDVATQRAAAFANLFDSPKNYVKGNSNVGKASPFSAYEKWSDLLTPEDLAILARNKDDLARLAKAEAHAKRGAKYKGDLGNSTETPQAPSLLNAPVTFVNWLSRVATGGVKERVANQFAKAAETPEGMATLLDDAMTRKAQMERFYSHVGKGRNALREVNERPAVYNALDADRRDQEKRRRKTKAELEKENREILNHL